MCGISGVASVELQADSRARVAEMVRRQSHRGPDADGIWCGSNAILGHNRLSIIDLVDGAQPMSTPDGRYTLIFNGEIYNYRELRAANPHYEYRTQSDTEVLLHMFVERGKQCLQELNGMFAFALWDSLEQTLYLARDRLGVKPLYYCTSGNEISFASEINALTAAVRELTLDDVALYEYVQNMYVPSPRSIYTEINKLEAASILTWSRGDISIERYWDPWATVPDESLSADAAIDEFHSILDDATRLRMISDVPLGAFLSGGIDSSTVVSAMARQSEQPVKTFSIGFDDEKNSELKYARMVAAQYRTDHCERILHASAVPQAIDDVIRLYGEPFGDSSAIPTYLVSKVARERVTVALSGDGGDEFFAGYGLYGYVESLERASRLPRSALRLVAGMSDWLPGSRNPVSRSARIRRFARRAQLPVHEQLLSARSLIMQGKAASLKAGPLEAKSYRGARERAALPLARLAAADQAMRIDAQTYLADELLVKVDRASMAASLEVRSPFLDYRMAEFALRVPFRLKRSNGIDKFLVRKAMEPHLPHELLYREKQGFTVPLNRWFRGDLREYANDTILGSRNLQQFFPKASLIDVLDEHHREGWNHADLIWSLLVLARWFDSGDSALRTAA